MSVDLPHIRLRTLAFVFGILLFAETAVGAQPASDRPPTPVQAGPGGRSPRPVLLVYSQHPLPAEMWTALFAALEGNLPEAAALVPAGEAHPEFVRGDSPANANVDGQPVTVYLNGDCRPSVLPVAFPQGRRLGWVSKVDSLVVPIIHVECTEISGAISGETQWMNPSGRTTAMSQAMARVILHEFVHVATQSATHGAEGVTKAKFGAKDLLAGEPIENCEVGR
jgi:hypothetical protein